MIARVLLADGNTSLLKTYSDFLARKGYAVATAATGLECVERLREFQPDVLVLEADLQWGWAEGVLARLSEDPDLPCPPVIVLADPYERSSRARFAPFHIAGFHLKPVMPGMLALWIHRLVEGRQALEPRAGEQQPALALCS